MGAPERSMDLVWRREYNIGLRCEMERKALAEDPKRAAELAAYFTHAKMQPGHIVLSLRSAMTQFYKLENFATAAIFARRLLEMNAPSKVAPAPSMSPADLAHVPCTSCVP